MTINTEATRKLARANRLVPGGLAANQRGDISGPQRFALLLRGLRELAPGVLLILAGLALAGYILFAGEFAPAFQPNFSEGALGLGEGGWRDLDSTLLAIGVLAALAYFAVRRTIRSLGNGAALIGASFGGGVGLIEGPLYGATRTYGTEDEERTLYYYEVFDVRVPVTGGAYRARPKNIEVRLYHTTAKIRNVDGSRTPIMLNIEVLGG